MRQRLAFILAAAGCVAAFGAGPATASAGAAVVSGTTTQVTGLAGYHFSVSSATTAVHARGAVTVPTATCGAHIRRYQVQIGAGFTRNGQHENAIVVLLLNCKNGVAGDGRAQIVAGYNVKEPYKRIKPGQTVRIRVSVTASEAIAKIIYPNGRRVKVTAGGGQPTGVAYALTLPSTNPPHYAPIVFKYCSVNRMPLSTYNPDIWESVIQGTTTVDGQVSALTDGTYSSRFTITYPPASA